VSSLLHPRRRLFEDNVAAGIGLSDMAPSNDPPFGGEEVNRRCVICHASKADE
jgi:hypothetical protein